MRATGNQLKKQIRTAVPELKHRDLSVKYDGSYHIKVKTFTPLHKIKEVTDEHESYRVCQASGEILSGGNTFVFVDYMTWDTNKDESFEVPVPQEAINQVEEVVKSFFNMSWSSGDAGSRSHHLSKAINERCSFFRDWTESDISRVMSLISNNSKKVRSWIKWDKSEMDQYILLENL